MPNCEGRFHLHSDMSKFATGSTLYQIQNRKPKLIAYASKRFPKVVSSYSITELELWGLVINRASFSHLLKRVDFDVIVGHLALTHIIKSKAEAATTRIKGLLELISSYSFNLCYMKGKDMILSDIFQDRHMTIGIHMISFQFPSICITYCMSDIIRLNERKIFSTDMFTNNIKWSKITKCPWCK